MSIAAKDAQCVCGVSIFDAAQQVFAVAANFCSQAFGADIPVLIRKPG
jgi:hypothetical protein